MPPKANSSSPPTTPKLMSTITAPAIRTYKALMGIKRP
jgi:hypothetical protein